MLLKPILPKPLFLIACLFLAPGHLYAQAVTVISNSVEAQHCYTAAILSTRLKSGSNDDIALCSQALKSGKLRKRDRSATHLNRGIIYTAMQNYDAAIEDYNMAKELTPNKGEIYVNRGNIYYLGAQYEKAINEYNKALDLRVKSKHVAYTNMGMSLHKLGNKTEAAANYRKALEVSPNFAIAEKLLEKIMNEQSSGS